MSQPIIHVLVDFYYGGQQQWNNLHRTPVARILVIMNDFTTDTTDTTHTKKDREKERERQICRKRKQERERDKEAGTKRR